MHKRLHYFDETTSSKPDLSQSVTPVTPSLAKLNRVCAQPCYTCTPFAMQGYDNTLCSLKMKRPDRSLVPQERRRRPHVNAFADLIPIDESTLIEKTNDWMSTRTTMKSNGSVTSQHVLYYCTYYSVSFTCAVHCTYYTYCTLYILYMFPVSLFPMLRFHLQHLFTLLFTLISSLVHSPITCVHTAFILTKLLSSA